MDRKIIGPDRPFQEHDALELKRSQRQKVHVGKLVKPNKDVMVEALCKRGFRHQSQLKTTPTDVVHLIPCISHDVNSAREALEDSWRIRQNGWHSG